MAVFDDHVRRSRQPVRLFGALVPRGVSVLFYSVRMAPDQYEPHSRLRANRLMPTLAAMLRTIETLFPAHRLLLASCLPCGLRTASCIRANRRCFNWIAADIWAVPLRTRPDLCSVCQVPVTFQSYGPAAGPFSESERLQHLQARFPPMVEDYTISA